MHIAHAFLLAILVAVTGVGAGDLATASFAGIKLGVSVLWVIPLGAFLKYILNIGLVNWQCSTGTTILEGTLHHFGLPAKCLFGFYLILWSYLVCGALMSACGTVTHAIFPLDHITPHGKLIYGILHSILAVILILRGGFAWFERIMTVCIGIMFCSTFIIAAMIYTEWGAALQGAFIPSIPNNKHETWEWILALGGGVGGTLTVLSYSYWMREANITDQKACRISLRVSYTMIALFGMAILLIASTLELNDSKGVGLLVAMSDQIALHLNDTMKWVFLSSVWCAVFSSLLGVWQSVPLIFTNYYKLCRDPHSEESIDTHTESKTYLYRGYLFAIATIPMASLMVSFEQIQKMYALFGAAFIPLLAITLLYLNSKRAKLVTTPFQNSIMTTTILIIIILTSGLTILFKYKLI